MKTTNVNNEKESYNVCLMGASLGTFNMGVSALAASLIKIISEIKPNAEISLLIGNRSSKQQELKESETKKKSIQVINFRLSPKANLQEHLVWIFLLACLQRIIPLESLKKVIIGKNSFLRALYSADFIGDIRGGDSFSDIYGLRRLIIGSMPSIITILLKKKLILLPQTYGPYKLNITKYIARFVISNSAIILSRDKISIKVIRDLIRQDSDLKNVAFCPDVAFMLDAIKPEQCTIKPPIDLNLARPLIGVNINGLMYNGGFTRNNMFGLKMDYKKFMRNIITTLLDRTSSHILLIPHTYGPQIESDPDACADLMKSLANSYKARVYLIVGKYDQSEIKNIIGQCNFFIGSRMHACIAALSQGIPTIGVAYSQKFKGIFDSVDAGNMIVDARYTDGDTAINNILSYYRNNTEIKNNLLKNILPVKMEIRKTFNKILSHINDH